MKFKKAIVIFLLAVLLVTQLAWISTSNVVYATGSQTMARAQVNGGFHYEQLSNEAKKIYQAIYNMYTEGILKTGTRKL